MILYNASTSAGLRNFTRFLTNTNTTTYTDADLDASLNMYYHMFVNEALQAMDDWDFQLDSATADLVANQQEYVFPSTILKIKRIEVSYDGTTWYKVTPMDINERGKATSTTDIRNDFTVENPYADIMDNSIFLYPIPTANVTGGIKIWYAKEATELSAATDEPNLPEAYHKGLCYGAAMDYFDKYLEVEGNNTKRSRMNASLEDTLDKLRNFFNTKNMDRDYVLQPAHEGVDSEYGYTN